VVTAGKSPVNAANTTNPINMEWAVNFLFGTERDTILQQVDPNQNDSKLTGTFQGKLGNPKVSGSVYRNCSSIDLRHHAP
jgi:hypothetical protein